MKKIVVFIFCALLTSTFASAEELLVQLKSGNSVIIEYTGTIGSVSMVGETDAIKTMNFQKDSKQSTHQIATPPHGTPTPTERTKIKDQESGWVRMKMVDPISED